MTETPGPGPDGPEGSTMKALRRLPGAASGSKRVLDVGAAAPFSEDELTFRYSRSGGPGGQHVNTFGTRVELVFDLGGVPRCPTRSASSLAGGCAPGWTPGKLRIVAQDERSQTRNRALAVERFCEAMRDALAPPPPPRRPTRPTRAAREGRLHEKRLRGTRKRLRRPPPASDD